jgi:agmatinase
MTGSSRKSSDRINRPFVGIPSFLRAPICTDLDKLSAAIAVMGVPFDEGSPYLAGSRMGPRALREHSLRFVSGAGGFYNPETRKTYLDAELTQDLIADIGDADVAPTNVERTFADVTSMVRSVLDHGALPVVLGGDHSITYPVVRGFSEKLHVIHFDAHSDYAPFIHDLRFTNGHAFRHIAPMKHVESLTQVGIRSLRHSPAMVEDSINDGNRVVTMPEGRGALPASCRQAPPSMSASMSTCSISRWCRAASPPSRTA